MAECDDRDRRRSARRITAAGFPREKWRTDFDYTANPHIEPAVIAQLAACAWITEGEPLCLIGDSGTGKSHLLIGLGAAAAMAGHRVNYVLAAELVNELVEAATNANYPRPSPATAGSTCFARTSSATWSSTGAAPSCCSRSSPNARRRARSRSPATRASAAGPRPSPTHDSAPPASTASPSAATSSKPAPPATDSHTLERSEQAKPPTGTRT